MTVKNRKVSEAEVSQTIDLKELLGGAAKNDALVQSFVQSAVEKIQERTQNENRDINGKLFSKYSKSYKESLAFDVFKTAGQRPDMTMTGSMMSDIQDIKKTGNKVTIGFMQDVNNAKAYAHITGFKGHPTLSGKVKPRDFFGLTDKELKEISKEYKINNTKEVSANDDKILAKLLAALKRG